MNILIKILTKSISEMQIDKKIEEGDNIKILLKNLIIYILIS